MNKLLTIEYDGVTGLMHFHRERNSHAYYVTIPSWVRLFAVFGTDLTKRELHFFDEWRWVWSIRTCPACYGTGVLHADGYPSKGCFRCDGSGEIID